MLQRFPIIVELLGPSGSGKSSILSAVKDQLIKNGWLTSDYHADTRLTNSSPLYKSCPLDDFGQHEFVRLCFEIALRNNWAPSQALSAINILRASMHADVVHRMRVDGVPLVHDELLLHRAFSFLPRSSSWKEDTGLFFEQVPLPTAAVVVRAGTEENLLRLHGRGFTNVTRGLSEQGLKEVVERSQAIATLAVHHLRERGLPVLEIDSRQPIQTSARQLLAFVQKIRDEVDLESPQDFLCRQIIQVSGSFHTRGRRHTMRTQGVAYGSFELPGLSLAPDAAQRDTRKRLFQFGITRGDVQDKRILDIGCNTGAILFELTKLGIASGYGVEIDVDKVSIAKQVRNYQRLTQLNFDAVDIETLSVGVLPQFDITFALAVESHLVDKDRFYRLLGEVTRERVYFEANNRADISLIKRKLLEQGFLHIEDRGICVDDRDPLNHNRRLLVAIR